MAKAAAVLLVGGCAAFGAAHTTAARGAWYQCVRPSLAPPSAVFAAVWAVQYPLLAAALLVAVDGDDAVSTAAQVTQLLLGALWCRLYFGQQRVRAAAVCLGVVVACSGLVVVRSRRPLVRVVYGAAYLPWCAFALLLNLMSLANDVDCQRKSVTTNARDH